MMNQESRSARMLTTTTASLGFVEDDCDDVLFEYQRDTTGLREIVGQDENPLQLHFEEEDPLHLHCEEDDDISGIDLLQQVIASLLHPDLSEAEEVLPF